jgi:hypothetical protein
VAVVVKDLDLDGRPDVIVGGQGQEVMVLRNASR